MPIKRYSQEEWDNTREVIIDMLRHMKETEPQAFHSIAALQHTDELLGGTPDEFFGME